MRVRESSQTSNLKSQTLSIRCAIYTRKSTEEGLDQDFNTLDAQREAAEAYIASQKEAGWTCLATRYDDGGVTGANMERPALRRLLSDVEAGTINCVVVYKVDRLSRSIMDFTRIMEILEKHGASFVSVTQQMNSATSMGRLTLNVLLSFAQFEREIIAERTRDKISAARRKGKWTGGLPMLGYDIDPKGGKIIINEPEANRVREIFDLYLQEEAITPVVQELRNRNWFTKGWVTKRGKPVGTNLFHRHGVYRILSNPLYVGKVSYQGHLYPGEHQGIVDPDTWTRVQDLLRNNGGMLGRRPYKKYSAMLAGLIRCKPCDSPMIHTYTSKKGRARHRYWYYVCHHARKHGWDTCPSKSVSATDMERAIVERIRCLGRDEELISKTVEQSRAQSEMRANSLKSEYSVLRYEVKAREDEIRNLVGRLGGDDSGNTQMVTRLAEIQDEMQNLEQKGERIKREISEIEGNVVDPQEVGTALRQFDPIWETLTPRERNRIVHLLIDRVSYDGTSRTMEMTLRPGGIRRLEEAYAKGSGQ